MKFIAIFGWAVAGLLLLYLQQSWDRLPERVAVHFGLDLQPNGWGSKALLGGVTVLAAVLIATIATVTSARPPADSRIFAVVLVTLVTPAAVLWQAIRFNVTGAPIQRFWVWAPVLTAIALGLFAALGAPHSTH